MSKKNLSERKTIIILVIFLILLISVNLYDFIKNINIRNQGNIITAYVYDKNSGGRYSITKSYVKYNIDNIEYSSSVSHSYTEGEYISIYYNINNYSEITTDGEIGTSGAITFLVVVTSLSMLIIIVKNKCKK